MPRPEHVALFNFGHHYFPDWLEKVAEVAKPERWGAKNKVLELYLRANFEIAKAQGKVYEKRLAVPQSGHGPWRNMRPSHQLPNLMM